MSQPAVNGSGLCIPKVTTNSSSLPKASVTTEHWIEACFKCGGHAIVVGDNLASGCLEKSYTSLIDVRVDVFRVGFAQSFNIHFLIAFSLPHCCFYQPSSCDEFSISFFSVVPFSCSIGSLTSRNGLLDVIVDPWCIIDGGEFLGDVSPTRFKDSQTMTWSTHSTHTSVQCSPMKNWITFHSSPDM